MEHDLSLSEPIATVASNIAVVFDGAIVLFHLERSAM